MKEKIRVDQLLVQNQLAKTRSAAKGLILAGQVTHEGRVVQKPGMMLEGLAKLEVKRPKKFVSRGGDKISAPIQEFNLNLSNKIALDIGASTGGFTDCLLKEGVKKVYAVDVGYGQLDYGLRTDSRVVVMERTNARYLEFEAVGEEVDVIVMDVSFISIKKVLPAVLKILKIEGLLIALVKPQFEVGREWVSRGGVVREKKHRLEVLNDIRQFLETCHMEILGDLPSPLLGPAGNEEYFIVAKKIKG